MFRLDGKGALVTGASGGIGGAIARALHAAGASVVLSGTRAPVLEASLAPTGGMTRAADVPLGDYTLVVEGRDGDMTACRAEAPRAITGRSNQWEPIEL